MYECFGKRKHLLNHGTLKQCKPNLNLISLRLGFRRNFLSVHPNLVSRPIKGILEILNLTPRCIPMDISVLTWTSRYSVLDISVLIWTSRSPRFLCRLTALIKLLVAVQRQSVLYTENSGFTSPTLCQHISTFHGYRILFSIINLI